MNMRDGTVWRKHEAWGTRCFDVGRPEVQSFSHFQAPCSGQSMYHIDGLRADAVASMLYLDYGTKAGRVDSQTVDGGNRNLEAIAFFQKLEQLPWLRYHPDVHDDRGRIHRLART